MRSSVNTLLASVGLLLLVASSASAQTRAPIPFSIPDLKSNRPAWFHEKVEPLPLPVQAVTGERVQEDAQSELRALVRLMLVLEKSELPSDFLIAEIVADRLRELDASGRRVANILAELGATKSIWFVVYG